MQMENLNADTRRIMNLGTAEGVLINMVVPGSTAAAAGFRKGDVLLSINEVTMKDTRTAVDYVGGRRGGEPFTYTLIRDGKKISGSASFSPYPKEQYPDLELSYSQVKTELGLQRVIISRQKGKKDAPVVFFIGGIGCYSLDTPLDTARSETRLLNQLTRAGFTTVRLEKPGMGDAAGRSRDCEKIGFLEEVAGYVQAIEAVRKETGEAKDIYLIGHSMGGLMAPMIAAKTEVKGIIAYGTIGSSFIECLAKTRRTIGAAYGWSPEETDDYIKTYCECASLYFVNGLSTSEAVRKKPECGEYLSIFDLRSRKYNEELYAINIPAVWKEYKGKALLAWGESDYIAAAEDHQIITETVNRYHPGNASYLPVKETDHGMQLAQSFSEARTNPGPYNKAVGDLFISWLKKQSR